MIVGIDLGSIAKAKKKKKTKNRKRMGKLGNITRSSEDNLEVLFKISYEYRVYSCIENLFSIICYPSE